MKTGINSNGMQRSNRNLVIQILLEEGVLSRIDLSRRTNLNRATITYIINDFLSYGIIREDIEGKNVSKKGSKLRLVCPKGVILSARLTRTYFELCAFTIGGEKQLSERTPVCASDDIFKSLSAIHACIGKMLDRVGQDNVLGMCVGVVGPYIRGRRNTAIVTGFEQLSRIDFQKEIARDYPFYVITEHDTNLSALAEWRQLDLETRESARCLIGVQSMGMGIGAGIIIDGRLYTGAAGFAGEIGHMGINFNGIRSDTACRGMFEAYASTDSVTDFVANRLYEYPDSELDENSDYDAVCAAYKKNDSLAVAAMHDLAHKLAYGLCGIVYALNPDKIVLFEKYLRDDRFVREVRRALNDMIGAELLGNMSVEYASIEGDSTILGGYYRTVDAMLKEDLLLPRLRECAASSDYE